MNTEIVKELKRRQEILIENSKSDDIHILSETRFIAELAPIGYPFAPEPWMDADYVKSIMTKDEFHSDEYDTVFDKLYKEARDILNRK